MSIIQERISRLAIALRIGAQARHLLSVRLDRPISRRELLGGAAALGAAALVDRGAAAQALVRHPRGTGAGQAKVAIVGAGQTAEHGGEFIDSRHLRIRALCAELGLTLADVGAAGRRAPGAHPAALPRRRRAALRRRLPQRRAADPARRRRRPSHRRLRLAPTEPRGARTGRDDGGRVARLGAARPRQPLAAPGDRPVHERGVWPRPRPPQRDFDARRLRHRRSPQRRTLPRPRRQRPDDDGIARAAAAGDGEDGPAVDLAAPARLVLPARVRRSGPRGAGGHSHPLPAVHGSDCAVTTSSTANTTTSRSTPGTAR